MELSIIKKLGLFVLMLTVLFGGIYWLLRKDDPVLKISGEPPYSLYLNGDLIPITDTLSELTIQPGFYELYATKDHFLPISNTFNIEKDEQKELSLSFEFVPYLETLDATEPDQILASDYQEGKCVSRIGTGSTTLSYCYDDKEDIGNLFLSEAGKTKLLSSLTLPSPEIKFNQDSKQVLLYQSLYPNSSGYLIDLVTGFKEKAWDDQTVLDAQPYDTGFLLLVLDQETVDNFEEDKDIHFTPSLLYFLDSETNENFLIAKHIDYGHYCAVGKDVYFLLEDTRTVEKAIETISDLKEDLQNAFSDYVETEYIYRVVKTEIPSLEEADVAIVGSEIADPEILSCTQEEIVLRNYDDNYYRIALEESAMED